MTQREGKEMWIWRKIEKIKWTDKVTNIEVLGQVNKVDGYRKSRNRSPGLIFVRKHFLVGLYMREETYIPGALYGQDFVLVILTIY